MLGKLDPDDLARVLSRTGARDDSVLMGPKYGEDAAAMRLDDGSVLVANSDPLSLAKERLGTLAVHVACNDVAACGADPRWLTNVMFLPDDDRETLDALTTQMDEEARELGVTIVGGHSEFVPALERPMVSMTALGLADEYVPTGGAEPGDSLVLTKGAGIEGTAVLATDFRDDLALSADVLERAEDFFGDISVVPDARVLRESATAMHDPTEGGLVTGLVELASASGVRLEVDRSAVPVREETAEICEAMGVDPLRIFGSGALLAAVPEHECDDALAALDAEGIEASEIGVVAGETDDPGVALDGDLVTEAVRDDLYDLWE
ncbi:MULTISPECIES: AIR synthase family protein [Halorussus]|uniref:AIR synthase family protein n=1 Tax=Halorussus TaxID=1070314 RepID=UPI000E219C42|nr:MULTISPECIES: AIR synthase family protein [Halorussus]NHN57962.1 hydrogenase expression protein [Halorussus sp. JP-T4]